MSPLVAAKRGEALVLIDGFVRQVAALRLGLPSVFVVVVELSPVQMKTQLYLRNRERGLLLVEECRLVGELHDVDGLNQVQIGDQLERHKSWVCRRLSLLRTLSPLLLDDMALGLLGACVLRKLALLPVRNQEELIAVAHREGLGPSETSDFIELWQRAVDPEARLYLIEHPRDALRRARGQGETSEAPRMTESTRKLLRALDLLLMASQRLEHSVHQQPDEIEGESSELVVERQREADSCCRRALDALGRWIERQGGD
jgi:hypothetical protein